MFLSECRTRGELVAHLTRPGRMGGDWTVIASAVKPSESGYKGVLWTVNERKSDGRRFIGCDLLDSMREHGRTSWGYKDLEESMGPAEVSCPARFLELVPVPSSPYAAAWREKVRERTDRTIGPRAAQIELAALFGAQS
jgi:hypothetical protein